MARTTLDPRNRNALPGLLLLVLLLWGAASAHEPLPAAGPGAPGGHEAAEGPVLAAAPDEPRPAAPCPAGATSRSYEVAAIAVEITLNRYLDHDPEGRMFVLEEDLARVRQEEAANAAARSGDGAPAVSIGLQGDAIQPLVLRVNQGECLRVRLRNALEPAAPVGLEVHGSGLHLTGTGAAATAALPAAMVPPGEDRTYEWWVAAHEPEGTHYLHSHGVPREQVGHGLFGAVIVEPAGSSHLDPATGRELRSGWEAMIVPADGVAFREFVLFYHEVGNERYQHRDRRGMAVPPVDPYTGAYRPGTRAINYRSEPFMNRLQLQQERQGRFDESLAYSSYAFGDPATPIARSYLGDPVKQRLVHGGSEVFHVHHVHGGATRWPRQPGVAPSRFAVGLDKHPPLTTTSTRLDAQAAGPSESFDLEPECGSGGCQQGAGDYLIHCHVAHHYFAGMWMLWRVYNTLQAEPAGQDGLRSLLELPDRRDGMQPAVTSSELLGRTVTWKGRTFELDEANLRSWVERQLPARGTPHDDDAAVFDWEARGDLYLGEPDSEERWPGYEPRLPGERPPLPFDPTTGKLAYPWLRPHLGRRPPFAPNHGPAPFLEPIADGNGPALAGANGPWSLCPEGTRSKSFAVHAISTPVVLNERLNLIDPVGQLFVLKEDEERVRADSAARVPLAIRGNAGEDCIDVLFKSELPDVRENAFHSKANIHIHFVQFDVQGSDGLTAGYNFEQSVRPFTVEGEALVAPAAAGATAVEVAAAERFHPGALVGVGMDQGDTFEVRRVAAVEPGRLLLTEALAFEHAAGEIVSSEFVRYRWYPDVQFGTAYFHDHVLGLTSWRHGLFGALIAEPPGSSYHHPRTGQELTSGLVADVHTVAPLSADVEGSFRELVLFVQDDNPLTGLRNTTGGSLNLRVEPLRGRDDPATIFSSRVHGDPETPVMEALLGDPVVVRGLVAGANDLHTLRVDGHWFRLEADSLLSAPVDAVAIGISERADLVIPRAGGPQGMPGDYLVRNGRISKLREGSWGILRVLEGEEGGLRPLPGRAPQTPAVSVCPAGAPRKRFEVTATEVPLPMLGGAPGRIFVASAEHEAVASGAVPPEPWVVHANVGDCLEVLLSNALPDAPVSMHAGMLAADPRASGGIEVGRNPPQSVAPGSSRLFTFYAHDEVGETVALVTDGADPVDHPRVGLYGAIVVGAAGTTYTDPVTGEDASGAAGWRVDAHPPAGPSYRDFTLFLQDEDSIIGTAIMPYAEQVRGTVGLNYADAPIAELEPTAEGIFGRFREGDLGPPATPLLEAVAGDAVRIHVLAPSSEQPHVFTVEGHRWPLERRMPGASLVGSQALGALQVLTLSLAGGAGPAGTYLYGDHREPYRDAGLWGFLRIHPAEARPATLQPLPARR